MADKTNHHYVLWFILGAIGVVILIAVIIILLIIFMVFNAASKVNNLINNISIPL